MPRHVLGFAVAMAASVFLAGCATPKLFSIDQSEEGTKIYAGHIPTFIVGPREDEKSDLGELPPLFSIYHSKRMDDGKKEDAILRSVFFTLFRSEREGAEETELVFLQLLPIVSEIEAWDRHWSLFGYKCDKKGSAIGILWLMDFRSKK